MPVQYHFKSETARTPFRSWLSDATLWVVEVALLAVFLVMQWGFRIPEWRSDGERVDGVVVDRWVSGRDERELYSARIVDEGGRELELELHSGEQIGDEVEAIVFPGDDSKVASPGELQTYTVVWLGTLVGALLWPGAWYVCRFAGRRRLAPTAEDARRLGT